MFVERVGEEGVLCGGGEDGGEGVEGVFVGD